MSDRVFKLTGGRVSCGKTRIGFSGLEVGMIVEMSGTAWVVLRKCDGELGVFGLRSHAEISRSSCDGVFRVLGALGNHSVGDFA